MSFDEDDPDFNRSLLGRRPSMYGVPVGRPSSYRPWHFLVFGSIVAVGAAIVIVAFG